MRQRGHAILLGTGEEATEGIRFQHIPSCKGIQQNLLQNPVPAQGSLTPQRQAGNLLQSSVRAGEEVLQHLKPSARPLRKSSAKAGPKEKVLLVILGAYPGVGRGGFTHIYLRFPTSQIY